MSKETLTRAATLIKAGNYEEAQSLLKQLLRHNHNNVTAWWLLAHATKNPTSQRQALEEVLKRKPDHEKARRMLDALPGAKPAKSSDDDAINWRVVLLAVGGMVAVAVVLFAGITFLTSGPGAPPLPLAYLDDQQIILHTPDGNRQNAHEENNVFHFIWSLDGNRIAYQNRGVWIRDVATGEITQLSDRNGDDLYDWSPDGNQMAFEAQFTPSDSPIAIMNADGSNLRAIFEMPNDRGISDIAWSPDGGRLLFAGDVNGSYHLFIIDTNGNNLVQLTTDGTNGSGDWSPDGGRIVFARRAEDAPTHVYDLWMMNADGSNMQRITDGDGFYTDPEWSYDGRYIAFSFRPTATSLDSNIRVLDLETMEQVQVTDSGDARDPNWVRLN